jgi:hypothetical protein
MTRAVGIVALSLFLSTVPLLAAAAEPAGQSPSTIRVVARATVTAKPDQVEVQVGVTTDKKTATAAVAENDRKMEQVVAALKKEVGADGQIQTAQLSVSPRFEERKDESTGRILGYTVTNTVAVRTANIKGVGRLLDLAFQAGANTAERVDFGLKNPEAAQNEALRAASAKARARATAIAEGQGLRVGEVLSVSEGERYDAAVAFEGGAKLEKGATYAANVTIEPGSIEITEAVTVVFALKAR